MPPPDAGAAKAAHADAAPASTPHADTPPAAASRPADTPHADADAAVRPKPGPADGRGKIMADEPVDGHRLRVREGGEIEMCSPEPCPLLQQLYGDIINESEAMKAEMAAIRKLSKSNPKLAAKRTAALKKKLDHIARMRAPDPADLDKEFESFKDLVREEGGDPSDLGMGPAAKTTDSTAPKDHPLKQDIGVDVDEIKPVGGEVDLQGKPVPLDQRMKAATSLEDRELKDSMTNERSKGLGLDPRDPARLDRERKAVSLKPGSGGPGAKGNEHLALFGKPLGDIEELRAVHQKLLDKMKRKAPSSPIDTKKKLNTSLRRRFKGGATPEAELISGALERAGFGYVEVTRPDGKTVKVLRALSAQEMQRRGYVFSKRGGWTKAE